MSMRSWDECQSPSLCWGEGWRCCRRRLGDLFLAMSGGNADAGSCSDGRAGMGGAMVISLRYDIVCVDLV